AWGISDTRGSSVRPGRAGTPGPSSALVRTPERPGRGSRAEPLGEEAGHLLVRPEAWPPGGAFEKPDRPPALVQAEREARIAASLADRNVLGREERVVGRVHEQGRHPDAAEVRLAAAGCIVVRGVLEPVQRCRDEVVESPEAPRGQRGREIQVTLETGPLRADLLAQRAEEVRG